jgi:hypothetical protein
MATVRRDKRSPAPNMSGWMLFGTGHVLVLMQRTPHLRANREVLCAIETPPDSGIEERLDDVAARLWYLAEEHPYDPDTGQITRLRYTLGQLAQRTHERRARRLLRAREALDEYRRLLDPV